MVASVRIFVYVRRHVETRKEILEKRRRLKAEYGELFDRIAALLFRRDPVSIGADAPADEYEPDTGTILPRRRICHSEDDARAVVHKEFVRWFGPDIAWPRRKLWRHFLRDLATVAAVSPTP